MQLGNISAAVAVSDVIRTSLGPRAMLKMLMDPMGTIVMTNDGNAVLREIDVSHPAAKSMIEISRTQDEEVGDGTTSVIVLGTPACDPVAPRCSVGLPRPSHSPRALPPAGEVMRAAEPFLVRQMHPMTIVSAYAEALGDLIAIMENELSGAAADNSTSARARGDADGLAVARQCRG